MATDTFPTGSSDSNPARGPRGGRVIEYQQYIDAQLGRTRRRVKWVDLWAGLALLAAGVIGYFLLAAVVDHWVIPGGLGTTGRWLLLIGLLAGVAVHLFGVVVPFLLRKVNPVYAAAAIEQGGPMKNTLINFLLLRKEPAVMPEGVLDAMKEQAAVRLSTVPGDASVDRTALLRWCYVLAAVLIGALGYAMVSPKDSFRSIRRVISPWAELAAPTRVRIESVDPGDAQRRRDDVVTVTMRVAGVRESDAVVLFYSASGNPADDVPLPMQSDHNRYLWKVALPPGSEGLKQDLFYYIQAGDASTPRYRIKVLATPVINVRAVRFDYPAYTGLPPRTIERQGDLKALEGTRVTITAEANQPIRAAHVAFDKARNKDVELKAEGLAAVGAFDLALLKDRITPAHTSYVLRFANVDGEENPKPTEYKIEVTADQPPEARIVEPNTPADKELSLPLGSYLRVTAAARDPDFQLGELTVVLRKAGALLREEKLLAEPRYGEFSNTLVLNAERYNLRVGDKFTFRVRAADNKSPQPNVVETKEYTVVVVPGSGGQQPPDERGNPQNQPPQPNQGQPNQGQPQQNPNNGAGQNGNQPGNPGDRPQQGDQPQGNPPPNNGQQPNGNPQPGEQRPPNNGAQQPPPSGNNSGDPKNGGEGPPQQGGPQPGEQPNGNNQQPNGEPRPSGNQPNENPQQGNEAGNEKQNGGQNSEKQKPPEEPIDPNVDPGKAFDELQKHFDQQEKKNDPKASEDQPPSQPENGAQPNQKNDGQQGGSQPNGSQKSGGQENGGGKNSGESPNNQQRGQQQPGNEQNGSGEKSGSGPQSGAAQPQQGADGNKSGNEQKSGGSSGTGQSQSNAPPGDQQRPGGPRNQPSQKSGEQNAQPGGESGKPTGDGTKPNGERRPGENNTGGNAKQPSGDGASKTPSGNQPQTGNSKPGESGTGKPAEGQQPGDAAKPNDGTKPSEALKPDETAQPGAEQRPGAKPNDGQPGVPRESNPASSGNGTQSGGDSSKPEGKNPRAGEQPIDPQTGKPSVNEQNPAGAQKTPGGQEGQAPDGEGTPNQQERAKPRNQTGGQEAGGQPESSKEEGKTPSNSKTESDAQGGQSGDRSAKNGEKGGGQKSQQSGTGGAGQSQAGEQGGGVSGQEGNSATSNQGGDQVRSGDPTQGKPSQQPGTGTKSNNPGEQPGGEGSSKSGEAASGDSNNQPHQNSNQPSGEAAGGNQRDLPSKQGDAPPQTGNQSSSGDGIPNGEAGDVDRGVRNNNTSATPADPANLDYAQKVTDLTLERLKQQLDKGQVDPELLKRFKSREALEEFARRWDSMRQNAKEPGPNGDAARKQFQENLKSLGLRPGTTTQQGSTAVGDTFGSGRGGKRSEPPAKYADQYRAYTTGVGQSEK